MVDVMRSVSVKIHDILYVWRSWNHWKYVAHVIQFHICCAYSFEMLAIAFIRSERGARQWISIWNRLKMLGSDFHFNLVEILERASKSQEISYFSMGVYTSFDAELFLESRPVVADRWEAFLWFWVSSLFTEISLYLKNCRIVNSELWNSLILDPDTY